ncbi:hypothetical protein ABE504_16350 [Paenibacillus oryzisoli]|uniref:hypothetical protein n=1 Tax=Paenibacillus oryzisoli TaxID=1850517 RepID=UPI003D26B418
MLENKKGRLYILRILIIAPEQIPVPPAVGGSVEHSIYQITHNKTKLSGSLNKRGMMCCGNLAKKTVLHLTSIYASHYGR